MSLEYIGFHKHKPGRIHLFCPTCKRKMSNVEKTEYDPERAVLAHLPCEKCSSGGKVDGVSFYLDSRGKEVDWDEGRKR